MLNMWMINDDVDQHHIYSCFFTLPKLMMIIFSFSFFYSFFKTNKWRGKRREDEKKTRNEAKSKEAEES